jgi:probable selenium-dependent hydroxylase accessory protein YqeC
MGSLSAWFENLLFGDAENTVDGNRPAERNPPVVTVIGSGGKTSLIWHLAANLTQGRGILVTPTTKMLVPSPEEKLYDHYFNGLPASVPGVTLAGIFNEAAGKLESLPLPVLSRLITNQRGGAYDLVLIEGDGSRGLPLKAWAGDEPVVPDFTTLTIGVLPLWPLGKPVSENLIHRLPLFLSLTGAAAGETLRPEHITAIITGGAGRDGGSSQGGLFAKARGKKVLFFNQVEDDEALTRAREIVNNLTPDFRDGLSAIIAGSVRLNDIFPLPTLSSRRRNRA